MTCLLFKALYGQASCGNYLACNCGQTQHSTILNIFHCKR